MEEGLLKAVSPVFLKDFVDVPVAGADKVNLTGSSLTVSQPQCQTGGGNDVVNMWHLRRDWHPSYPCPQFVASTMIIRWPCRNGDLKGANTWRVVFVEAKLELHLWLHGS